MKKNILLGISIFICITGFGQDLSSIPENWVIYNNDNNEIACKIYHTEGKKGQLLRNKSIAMKNINE